MRVEEEEGGRERGAGVRCDRSMAMAMGEKSEYDGRNGNTTHPRPLAEQETKQVCRGVAESVQPYCGVAPRRHFHIRCAAHC